MRHSSFLSGLSIALVFSMAGLSVASGFGQDNGTSTEKASSKQDQAAVENVKKLLQESKQVFEEEVAPLQEEASTKSGRIQAQLGLQMQYLRSLKNVTDESLAKVRNDMQQMADRLEMLERLESVLTDMDPDAIEKAIAEGNRYLSELEQQRKEIATPINQEMANIIQQHAHRNKKLAEAVSPFFKKAGVNEQSGLIRKYSNANFAYRHYSCRYENEKENIVIHVTLHFSTDLTTKGRKVEKIDDKHLVYQWDDNHVILLIDRMHLNVHSSSDKWNKQTLMAAVKQLIDLEGLSRLAE